MFNECYGCSSPNWCRQNKICNIRNPDSFSPAAIIQAAQEEPKNYEELRRVLINCEAYLRAGAMMINDFGLHSEMLKTADEAMQILMAGRK